MWDVLVWFFIILALLLLLFLVPGALLNVLEAFIEFIFEMDDWD